MKRILIKAVPIALAAGSLAACGTYDVQEVRDIQPRGPAFTQRLAENYRDLAIYEADEMRDWESAALFARKAEIAANGQLVQVESVDNGNWDVPDERRTELIQGYQRLDAALREGARERFPVEAATAQAKYDCWIEQAEENWQFDHIYSCRDDFIIAVQALEQPIEPVVGDLPPPVLIFFDWDQADLEREAIPLINQLAQSLQQNRQAPIRIEGYADTSGPAPYNELLSMRRAETVRDALAERGIDPGRMELIAYGEDNLRVPTGDGVREPQNRRVRVEALRPAMAQR